MAEGAGWFFEIGYIISVYINDSDCCMLVPNINRASDSELLLKLKAGDRSGFESVYRTYAPSLIQFAAGKLLSLEEARDMIQDIFTNLWDHRNSIDIKSSLKAYLYASVRYRIIDHIRKNINRREYAAMISQLAENVSADVESAVHVKSIQQQLETVVDTLPARTKQIYRLSRQRHLAVKEIAVELGISEQSVKNQLSTAMNRLRISCSKLAPIAALLCLISG